MSSPYRVDLRSDTVTQPDEGMRRAMADAVVGDDVLEGDPTALALETLVAGLLGKDAGVFVSSGTQGNLVAQLAHRTHGRTIVAGASMHVEQWEAGGHAVVGGASLHLLPERADGLPDPAVVTARCGVTEDPHQALVGLVWSENTHGGRGGQPVTSSAMRAYRDAVPTHIPLHTDGARLLDAAVALDTDAASLVEVSDSATLCLSKGLGCPVGTVLVGNTDFIRAAKRARKLLGGGMRQVGILAAAGLHVLDGDGLDRTREAIATSHVHARTITQALTELPGVADPYDTAQPFDPSTTATNIIRFGVSEDVGGRDPVLASLHAEGIGVLPYGAGIRMVTHRRLDDVDVTATVAALREALA